MKGPAHNLNRFKVKHERTGIVGGTWGQQHTFRVVDMHRGLAVSRHISYYEAREACSRLNTAVEMLRAAANGGV